MDELCNCDTGYIPSYFEEKLTSLRLLLTKLQFTAALRSIISAQGPISIEFTIVEEMPIQKKQFRRCLLKKVQIATASKKDVSRCQEMILKHQARKFNKQRNDS